MASGDIRQLAIQELARRELARRRGEKPTEASAVPVPEGADISEFFKSTETEPEPRASYQLPHPTQTISRESGRAGLPIAGAMAAATGPGVVIPSLLAVGGGTAGRLGQQKLEGKELDLEDATKEGAKLGAGTLAGGLTFKLLGKAADKIFNPTPLSLAEKRAAKFAEKEGLPLPLEKGGGGLTRKGVSALTLPARWATEKDANKITQFINKMALDEAPKLAPQAKPVAQVAEKGKEFFKNIYFPAKEAGQEGFDKFITAVGANTPVRVGNLSRTVTEAVDDLAKRGFVSTTAKGIQKSTDKLGKYLLNLKNNPAQMASLEDVEVIRKTISKLGSRSEVKTVSDKLKEAILRDYDDVGSQIGVSARELAADAIQKSAKFFQLKKSFPELEFFARTNANSEAYLGMLFKERNAAALAEIRKQSPELYKELSDTWLASIIQSNTRATDGVIGKILDGPALRKWFESNNKELRKVLGKQKAQVLDNFSRYAAQVTPAVKRADRDTLGSFETIVRGGAELGAFSQAPYLMVPGEVTAYMLAKGLSNPSSKLFKLFTKGPGKGFKTSTKGALMLGGQAAFTGEESP